MPLPEALTTKATTEACYALLLRGTDLLASDNLVEIKVGNKIIDPNKLDDVKVEAGVTREDLNYNLKYNLDYNKRPLEHIIKEMCL